MRSVQRRAKVRNNPPIAPIGAFGAGVNAPNWSGKTVYPIELFTTPMPVHYAAPNVAGFKGFQGFDGAWDNGPAIPSRVTYPTVATPIGTKPVLQVRYPGQTTTMGAVGATTPVWPTGNEWAVAIRGTFVGTFLFERSLDGGVTWNPVPLRGTRDGSGTSAIGVNGSSVSVTGIWVTDSDYTNQLNATGQFRVRMTAWTSGSAQVSVGIRGGESPARFSAGDFAGYPTRVYTRLLIMSSANWTDGGNTGTKGFFINQQAPANHYTGLFSTAGIGAFIALQNNANSGLNRNMTGTATAPSGVWADLEFMFVANTPGVGNGVARVWLNGTLVLDVTDVLYFTDPWTNPGFPGFWMDPTYGGGEAPPPDDIHFRIAGWYRESAP